MWTSTLRWLLAVIVVSAAACDDDSGADAQADGGLLDAGTLDGSERDAEAAPDAAADMAPEVDALPDAGPAPDMGPAPFELRVRWNPCLSVGVGAQCAFVEVPADWANPNGPKLEVRVIRLTRANARGQLWMLAGGPGQSGRDLFGGAAFFDQFMPGLDLYLLDFRGTGASSYLGCDADLEEPSERAACVEQLEASWSERLAQFTVTAAARDLGELIAATRAPGAEVVVNGGSFGTYWAHRYLQLYPEQPTAVILDGLCPPGTCDFSVFQSAASNEVARTFFAQLCAADEICNEKLGGDPWGFVGDLHARLAEGEWCPDLGADNESLREYLVRALMNPSARALLPAVLYRFDRCEPADVEAVEHYNRRVFGVGKAGPDGGWSDVLRAHVVVSELFPDPPPTLAEVEAVHAGLYSAGPEVFFFAELAEIWPRYPRDAWIDGVAETDVPVLMLNGTLDPATSPDVAERFRDIFDGPNQHFVLIDHLGHGTLFDDCAQRLIRTFLEDPTGPLDAACATDRPAPDLSPEAAAARMWLGVDDAWENAVEE